MNKVLKEVMQKILNSGFEVYLVGGYVRDYCLNIKSNDYDLATSAKPADLKLIWPNLKASGYGSVVLNYKGLHFEITTYRIEKKYKNKRFPIFKYTSSIDDDIRRRDFTINSLYMDIYGVLIDKLNGKKDIENKIIKMVGNPYQKINEDALRILRAVRFATLYNFKIDDELYKAIKELNFLVGGLSPYRKKMELDKIFASKNIKYGLKLITDLGLYKYLDLENIEAIKPVNNVLGIWAQFDVLNIYPFNKIEQNQILKIKENLLKDVLNPIVLYRIGLYIALTIGEINRIKPVIINEAYENLPIKSRQDILLKPKDICEILKIKPGKLIGDIYTDLENQILKLELINEKTELEKYLIKKYS